MNTTQLQRSFTTLAAGLLLAGTLAGPAAAAPQPTNANVNAGPITVSGLAVADFPATTLDGTAKPVTATMADLTITDSRGNGFGWNVTIQAGQFAEWDATANGGAGGYVSGGKTLALNSLQLPTPAVTADGTDSPPPSVMAGPHRIDTTAAVKIVSAAEGTGMGKYIMSVTEPLELTLPANAYAGSYRSDVTVSIVSGP